MFKKMLSKATDTISNISLEKTIEETVENVTDNTNSIIEKYWPMIEQLLLEQLLLSVESGLNNDEIIEKIFFTAYDAIPFPVKLILPQKTFVKFCLNRKNTLLMKVKEYKGSEKSSINVMQNATVEEHSTNLYSKILPELLALCIVADGIVEKSELQLATDIIMNDLILDDKEQALKDMEGHIGKLMVDKINNQSIYKLKSMNIYSLISKIEDEDEKNRIDIIARGMAEIANKEYISDNKKVTDSILNSLN